MPIGNDRAQVFEKAIPPAFDNIWVAPRRNKLRYARTQFNGLKPKCSRLGTTFSSLLHVSALVQPSVFKQVPFGSVLL
jgi:hypothetical protein